MDNCLVAVGPPFFWCSSWQDTDIDSCQRLDMRHITLKLIEHWLVYTLNSPFISLISIALNATGPLYNRKHQSHEAQTHAINNQLGTILSRSRYSDVINSVWFLIVWKTHDLYTTSYNNYSEQEGTNVFQKCTCIVCVYRNFPLKSHSNCSYYSSIVFFRLYHLHVLFKGIVVCV